MLSSFFLPVEHFGVKFDRAMQLFEFDAIREPEKTQFPLIGDFVRRHIEMVKIPTPVVLMSQPMPYTDSCFWPDLFIANRTRYFLYAHHAPRGHLHTSNKAKWSNDIDLASASHYNHGAFIHDSFIEPFVQKVCGLSSTQLVAKYHRAIWCPLYWPESLGTDWETAFWYPKAGYAGRLAEVLGATAERGAVRSGVLSVETRLAYCLATVKDPFSVLFVPDMRYIGPDLSIVHSPIYRITDQDVCARINTPIHRIVVEYRGECDVSADLAQLGITVEQIAYGTGKIVPPTSENVGAGYDFGNNMNSQLMEYL